MKTVATEASVTEFLAAIPDPQRRADCQTLCQLMSRVTGYEATMWGQSIVGFGCYQYHRANQAKNQVYSFFRVGFSPRKAALTIYIMPGYTDYSAILSRLGPHKIGKCCLYLKRLADIDMQVLKELIEAGYRDICEKYPETPQT